MTTAKRFALAISPVWRPALLLFGVTPKRSFIEIGEEDLHVCFGRLEYHFPLEAAEDVTLSRWPLWAGIGARTNFRGAVGLVGTYVNVVKITFKKPQQIRLLVRTTCKELFLSVEEPHAFVTALKKHLPVQQAKAA
jgi:hypothetical protein